MDLTITLGVGLVVGALATWFIGRDEKRYLRDELKVAHAQIAHAVIQEGAQIPARFEAPEPVEPLTAELMKCVEQWEGAENQVTEEAKIRQWLAEGRKTSSILRQYGVKA